MQQAQLVWRYGGLTNISSSFVTQQHIQLTNKYQAIECILIFINFTQQRFRLTDHGIPPHRQALTLAEIMNDRALKYIFGLLSTLLLIGLIYKLTKLPGGMILPGYFLGGIMLIGALILSLLVAGISKLIFRSNSFLTLFAIVSSIAFGIFHYYWYSPTLKIIVPKGYSGEVTLVLSNVDKNILTVDSNGIGYITKWTFDKTFTPPIVYTQYGEDINDLIVGFNPSTFWAKGTAISTDYSGEIKYLSFKVVSKDTMAQKKDYGFDFSKFVDRSKLIQ